MTTKRTADLRVGPAPSALPAGSVRPLEAGRLRAARSAFVTRRVPLEDAKALVTDARPAAGDLVLARVKRIRHHGKLQCARGRRVQLFHGDEIVVCYGDRYAPQQFEAYVPRTIGHCHLVASGGVAAQAVNWHQRIHRGPTEIEALGILADEHGNTLNLRRYTLPAGSAGEAPPRVIVVAGTSMDSGKTTAGAHLVRGLTRAGLRVGAAKITGTGACNDYFLMKDAGAEPVLDFTDAGYVSTYRVGEAAIRRIYETLIAALGRSAIDVLRGNRNVNLVALYGPEHGIYGDEEAGQLVEDRIDARTGLPVYSLYGKYRKPTPEMLEGIDVLVIDLQDIGVRSYTFVSCMKLAIEACFQADKEVIVLDRPNPLGGLKVDGPMIDRQWLSYVGAFPVPYVHGLTIGELARMAVMEPGILNVSDETRRSGQLAVVTMNGWRRYMSWPQTGLQWKPTSINVPTFQAAVGYAMTGLGTEIGGFSHGLGTKYPFRFLTYEDGRIKEAQRLLKAASIPGIALTPERIGPDQQLGLYVEVIDWNEWRPTEISFHMMRISAALSRGNPFSKVLDSPTIFNKLVGSTAWLREISNKGAYANVKGYVIAWERDARQFQLKSRRYWLYD